jgi:lipopolysaccharide export system permease protein
MRLTWYIIRLHIGPFLFGTFAVVFIFLLQFIFKVLNELVGKGISYWVIAQFITYNLAWMLVLAVPMGVLVASLMAYGKLSGSNELTIIKSSGGSALRAMRPSLIGGAFLFLALYLFNDKVLPETNHRAYVMQTDIKQVKPTFAIDPGKFITIQQYSILAREVDHVKNELKDVTIYGQDGDVLNVINAKRARLRFTEDLGKMLMIFNDGEIHQVNRRTSEEFRRVTFMRHQVAVATSGFKLNKTDPGSMSRNDRTMSISAMRAVADTAEAVGMRAGRHIDSLVKTLTEITPSSLALLDTTPRTRQESARIALEKFSAVRPNLESEAVTRSDQIRQSDQFWVEIHKKYSIPAACLIFVLVGAPLGIVVKRGNFGVSAAIALGFFVIYWSFLVAGEKLADRAVLPPGIAMWLANVVIGLIGLYLTILVSRETITFNFDFNFKRRKKG